ncbi:MAG: hypothetical protein M3O67_05515, partial [Bacteroidota bacterium]|nr:hypothetical protein [Bacteroidota bacterium]
MKKQIFFLLLFAGISYQFSCAQIKETDTFINELFSVLKQQDEKRFVKLFPDATRFKKLLLKMMNEESPLEKNDSAKQKQVEDMLKEITNSSIQKQFAKVFENANEKAKNKNIDWANAKLVSYKADTTVSDFLNTKELNGIIYLNSKSKDYFILFGDVIWSNEDNGWYGVEIKKIGEKGIDVEYNNEDENNSFSDSNMVTDTVVTSVDTVAKLQKPGVVTNKKAPIKKPVSN